MFDECNRMLLAICLWREARGEGIVGMRAVGWVIRNRVMKLGQPWFKVITSKNQFSSMSVLGDSQTIVWGDPSILPFQEVCQLAKLIYEGTDTDPTNGALYYYNPVTATSKWFKENIVDNPDEHPSLGTIGNHTFYA